MRATDEVVTKIKEGAASTGLVVKENKTMYVKISRNV